MLRALRASILIQMALGTFSANADDVAQRCVNLSPTTTIGGDVIALSVQYCGLQDQQDGGWFPVTVLQRTDGTHLPVWPGEFLRNRSSNAVICLRAFRMKAAVAGCNEFVAERFPAGLSVDSKVEPLVMLLLQERWQQAAAAAKTVIATTAPNKYGAWPAIALALGAPPTTVPQHSLEWQNAYYIALRSLTLADKAGSRNAEKMLEVIHPD